MQRIGRALRKAFFGEELVAELGSVVQTLSPGSDSPFDARVRVELVRFKGKLFVKLWLGFWGDWQQIYLDPRRTATLQALLGEALGRMEHLDDQGWPQRGTP